MARPIDQAREEAKQRGEKRYFSTRPCPHNHVGSRFVISASCCTCADIARAERIAARGGPKRPGKRPVVYVAVSEPSHATVSEPLHPDVTVSGPQRPVKIKAPSPMALARASGAEIYIGAPCKLGHVKRYTSSGHCTVCKPRKVTAPKVWVEPKPKEPKPVHTISARAKREAAKKAAEEARKQFPRTTKLGTLLADYHHTSEACERSRYLDRCLRTLDGLREVKPAIPISHEPVRRRSDIRHHIEKVAVR